MHFLEINQPHVFQACPDIPCFKEVICAEECANDREFCVHHFRPRSWESSDVGCRDKIKVFTIYDEMVVSQVCPSVNDIAQASLACLPKVVSLISTTTTPHLTSSSFINFDP
jgi:hypothetical protein